ncbi:MAG: hypothetical protein WB678_16845 [Stellaceae bacterium]
MSLVDARPYGGKKKGADGGIDGIPFFRSDKDQTEKALISVKGGETWASAWCATLSPWSSARRRRSAS